PGAGLRKERVQFVGDRLVFVPADQIPGDAALVGHHDDEKIGGAERCDRGGGSGQEFDGVRIAEEPAVDDDGAVAVEKGGAFHWRAPAKARPTRSSSEGAMVR